MATNNRIKGVSVEHWTNTISFVHIIQVMPCLRTFTGIRRRGGPETSSEKRPEGCIVVRELIEKVGILLV